jgi:hypothetical protein
MQGRKEKQKTTKVRCKENEAEIIKIGDYIYHKIRNTG